MPSHNESEERYLAIVRESRPVLSNEKWLAAVLVLRDAQVDPAIWQRPGEYIAGQLLMSDHQPILDRLGINNQFLSRLCALSPAEGWSIIEVAEGYWSSEAMGGSIEAYLRAEGLWR